MTTISERENSAAKGLFQMEHDSNVSPNGPRGNQRQFLVVVDQKKPFSETAVYLRFYSLKKDVWTPWNPKTAMPQRDYSQKSGFFLKKKELILRRSVLASSL
ncbi:hypothetical protein JTE90_001209 [Oedothorax gibbosus]|uniref:Uncharacterized protein n=1 Tax=Oedothorax gibbosus TaxID=931172 RepID=A0AAV6UWI9_9ARAC|nr:hypothetical protein JTE90_001209 [Oedothorax gibbosus]